MKKNKVKNEDENFRLLSLLSKIRIYFILEESSIFADFKIKLLGRKYWIDYKHPKKQFF